MLASWPPTLGKLAHANYRDFFSPVKIEKFIRKKKVQVGKDQEKAQSEKDSHSKNQGGKKPN